MAQQVGRVNYPVGNFDGAILLDGHDAAWVITAFQAEALRRDEVWRQQLNLQNERRQLKAAR